MPQIELTPAQRKAQRAAAHHLEPVVHIGAECLSAAVLREVDAALSAHGLIKIRALCDDRVQRETWLQTLAAELSAAPIQHLGKLLLLWRPKPQPDDAAASSAAAERGAAPREYKVLKYSKKGGQRPEVKMVRVLGNQRLTSGGLVKKARPSKPKSVKKAAQAQGR